MVDVEPEKQIKVIFIVVNRDVLEYSNVTATSDDCNHFDHEK